jgi:hypothetical protein
MTQRYKENWKVVIYFFEYTDIPKVDLCCTNVFRGPLLCNNGNPCIKLLHNSGYQQWDQRCPPNFAKKATDTWMAQMAFFAHHRAWRTSLNIHVCGRIHIGRPGTLAFHAPYPQSYISFTTPYLEWGNKTNCSWDRQTDSVCVGDHEGRSICTCYMANLRLSREKPSKSSKDSISSSAEQSMSTLPVYWRGLVELRFLTRHWNCKEAHTLRKTTTRHFLDKAKVSIRRSTRLSIQNSRDFFNIQFT